jgi:hypothetical protein
MIDVMAPLNASLVLMVNVEPRTLAEIDLVPLTVVPGAGHWAFAV